MIKVVTGRKRAKNFTNFTQTILSISPERLWLTWLLVNVAHLAIPCTAACFKFRLLWFIRSTRISACLGASPTLGFCISKSVSVISNCDQLWVSVSSCSFISSSYWAFKASGETVSNSTAAKTRKYYYCKCSKISNTFLFPFSNKMLVIGAGFHKMFVRISNREDPDQTDCFFSSSLTWACTVCLGIFSRQLASEIFEHLL